MGPQDAEILYEKKQFGLETPESFSDTNSLARGGSNGF